jgi:hypothetical protein
VPEAGSLACKKECDGAGFRLGRSDRPQALFCTTISTALSGGPEAIHIRLTTCILGEDMYHHANERSNSLHPLIQPGFHTRDDSQYRLHFSPQIQPSNHSFLIWNSLVPTRTRRRSTRGRRRVRRRPLARALVVAASVKVATAVNQVHTLAHTPTRAGSARGPGPRV